MKALLYIAIIIGCFTYMFWDNLPKGSFYIGNALFIFLISTYLWVHEKKSFICFILFALSLSNLLDELYFNPRVLGLNELALIVILPIIWFMKFRSND